jgi:thiol-disulfide isomerase/thioredoxin
MSLSKSSKWILFVGTWLMGIVFTAAAFLKALDFNSFVQQISRYQLVTANLELPLGVALITLESVLGLACLLNFRPRIALWGMIVLLALFLTATLFRWTLLQDTNCNCFGSLVTGGPRAVVLHTAVFISLAAILIALMRKTVVPTSSRGLRVVAGVFAMFLLIFAAQPTLQSSILSEDIAGDQTRIFLSATCEKCQKEADKVRLLANTTDIPQVHVFIGAAYQSEIDDYFKKVNLQLKYTPLTFSQLSRETQHVPKVQIFRDGKLVKEWEGEVPGLDEVRRVLLTGPQGVGNSSGPSTQARAGE